MIRIDHMLRAILLCLFALITTTRGSSTTRIRLFSSVGLTHSARNSLLCQTKVTFSACTFRGILALCG
jgi:hypothetical protein